LTIWGEGEQEQGRRCQITLIDQHPYHQQITLLHLPAAATLQDEDITIPLDSVLQHRSRAVRRVTGRVARIDPLQSQVILEDGMLVSYDRLVIALGAKTEYFDIPGAEEHTLPLHSAADATHLRNHIIERFREAAHTDDPAARRRLGTIAIVGGGPTGCQLAGELAARVDHLVQETGIPAEDVRIALLERTNRLLGASGEWVHREAVRVLDRRRVSVYLDAAVEQVEESQLRVSGQRVLRAATIVWVAGIRAPEVLASSGLPTDRRGAVRVDSYLRVEGQSQGPNPIFALGDCALVPDPVGGTVPPNANYALRQANYLAEALWDDLNGQPPFPYQPVHLGGIVSLGSGEAVGDPLGVPVSGPLAALLKQGVERWYRGTVR
jgi:NADH:ubiquinone reductase (H+-translocating)